VDVFGLAMAGRKLVYALMLLALVSTADGYHACVTGASGYLGSELVWQLLNQGHTVTAAVRRSDTPHIVRWQKEFPAKLDIHAGYDLREAASLDEALKRRPTDVLFHTAAPFPGEDVHSPLS